MTEQKRDKQGPQNQDEYVSREGQEGQDEERLARYLAHAGVTSRRHAEELIAAGRVRVNGETVKT